MMTPVSAAAPRAPAADDTANSDPILTTENLTIRYDGQPAVQECSVRVHEHRITAMIGPSGCGKSTLLRAFNRMNDFIPGCTTEGRVRYRGMDVYDARVDPVEVRRRLGMVFQKPNPFPKTIYQNIAWGPRINGYKGHMDELVERSLRAAALWDEVQDRLKASALSLSGGQQQRLCIARTIAMHPDVILMDEPCSALDPISTGRIEDLLFELRARYSIVIVTHNMQQASRVSDYTAFLDGGRLVEFGETPQVFTRPQHERTEAYVTGRFG